jgi:exosortase
VTSVTLTRSHFRTTEWQTLAPWITAGLAFLVLFWEPATTLARDWWHDPNAGHGLLLFPVAVFLAWQRGIAAGAAQPRLGATILLAAVVLRYLSGLAEELFTMRVSLIVALSGIIVFAFGWTQLKRWWLTLTLLLLSIPIPAVVLGSIALPLQLKASTLGASLLMMRHVPVVQSGNIIQLPNMSLFVAEACSGLRSLTALLALGVLAGGAWLGSAWARGVLILLAVPVAMALNGVRIFLAGFLVYYVDPRLADGFLHATEGWVLFVVAFALLALLAWSLRRVETALAARPGTA